MIPGMKAETPLLSPTAAIPLMNVCANPGDRKSPDLAKILQKWPLHAYAALKNSSRLKISCPQFIRRL
jgi:hypothetical protein